MGCLASGLFYSSVFWALMAPIAVFGVRYLLAP